jgi:hypothetical protein
MSDAGEGFVRRTIVDANVNLLIIALIRAESENRIPVLSDRARRALAEQIVASNKGETEALDEAKKNKKWKYYGLMGSLRACVKKIMGQEL